jgi:hypothetical protein
MELDLSQRALAERSGCAVATIRVCVPVKV